MKVGDLVKCTWQPRADFQKGSLAPMLHTIKDEIGIIIRQTKSYNIVLFPRLGYEHHLVAGSLEVVSEGR